MRWNGERDGLHQAIWSLACSTNKFRFHPIGKEDDVKRFKAWE